MAKLSRKILPIVSQASSGSRDHEASLSDYCLKRHNHSVVPFNFDFSQRFISKILDDSIASHEYYGLLFIKRIISVEFCISVGYT